jgi:hypothetical protein
MSDFQWIIDNAESISIDRNPIVGQSITRNQTVRTVSRGNGIWKFTVKLPDGLRWIDHRGNISKMEELGKFSTATIALTATGQNWVYAYQGNSANSTGFVASITQGSKTITLTTSPTTSSGYKFKAGDFIQLGSTGRVYTVAADVSYNSNSVTLNRPVIESSATGVALRVGVNCSWTVVCTAMPSMTLMPGGIIGWSGPFTFYENMV